MKMPCEEGVRGKGGVEGQKRRSGRAEESSEVFRIHEFTERTVLDAGLVGRERVWIKLRRLLVCAEGLARGYLGAGPAAIHVVGRSVAVVVVVAPDMVVLGEIVAVVTAVEGAGHALSTSAARAHAVGRSPGWGGRFPLSGERKSHGRVEGGRTEAALFVHRHERHMGFL